MKQARAAEKSEQSFSYVEVPKSAERQEPQETQDKFINKIKKNPLVPIGLVATIGILINGIWQMKTGNREKSQRMMRWRVLAQGLTVLALVGGIMISTELDRKNEEKKKKN